MRAIYDVPAPAKLNLFLHVTGRRADGYHLLQSAFMLIDWCDTLHFERRADGTVTREDLGEPLPENDLIVRAAHALRAATGCREGVHIAVHKAIPVQAGLGGGSSDAASCLLALNRLWDLNISLPALARIGLSLGADVPFFLAGRNAWVEGVGERLTPLDLPAARFLVVKPPQGLRTQDIFGDPDLDRNCSAATIAGFAANPWGYGINALQAVAERICPDVVRAIRWLKAQGLEGRMTGSGSAVFAHVSPGVARPAWTAPEAGWRLRECSNLDVHPLSGWASSDDSSVAGSTSRRPV